MIVSKVSDKLNLRTRNLSIKVYGMRRFVLAWKYSLKKFPDLKPDRFNTGKKFRHEGKLSIISAPGS